METQILTVTQKKALYNIKYAAYDLIGGLENTMLDNPEGSKDYEWANKFLHDHKKLVNELYNCATTNIYGPGYCCFNKVVVKKQLREINFCGKDWLMEQCENRVRKEGY